MPDQPQTTVDPSQPKSVTNVSGGITATDSQLSAGADIVGRDKITQVDGDQVVRDKITYVGMSPDAVRRLVITVGAIVFVTAACFFAGGVLIGARAIDALNRVVESTSQAAAVFAGGIQQLAEQPAGQPIRLTFTEQQLSSYIRLTLGPQIGLTNGRARLLPDGQVVFYGRWPGWLNLPVMAITSVQTNSDQLFRVNSAAFSLLPSADSNQVSNLGWIPLPAGALQPLVDQIGNVIGHNIIATSSPAVSVPDSPQVTVDVVTK